MDKAFTQRLFSIINEREDILRRLLRDCAYLKYVEARLGDRILYADEILKYVTVDPSTPTIETSTLMI